MKQITRYQAQKMLEAIEGMALGHLDADNLEAVLDNCDILKAEIEKLDKMKKELGRRLYQGIELDRMIAFYKAQTSNDTETIAKDYADLARLREKEIEVIVSLFNKVVDLDIREVDERSFVKAVLKAQPDTKMDAFDVLAPMFKAEEQEDDFSELDEITK